MHNVDEKCLEVIDCRFSFKNMFVFVKSSKCLPSLGSVRYKKRSPSNWYQSLQKAK